MNILIIGHGNVGAVLARLLKSNKRVDNIYCADKRIRRDVTGRKVHFRRMDSSDKKQLMSLLDEIRPFVVVNAAHPRLNRLIMGCCLRSRSNYLDLAAYWDFDPDKKARSPYKVEQLDFDERFRKNGLIGLINAGVAPGLTNLLAAECIDHLDTVKDIRIRLLESTGSDDLYFAWSKEWLLDQLDWKPLVYRNGKLVIADNFSGEETFRFPAPFGKRKVVLVSQEEIGTLPLRFNITNMDVKSFDKQTDLIRPLTNLGLTSHRKISFDGTRISPLEFIKKALPDSPELHKNPKLKKAVFAFTVEADGKKEGVRKKIRLSAIFPRQEAINRLGLDANFISYPTALAAYLFITNLDRVLIEGVFPPECLNPGLRKELIIELMDNHVEIKRNF